MRSLNTRRKLRRLIISKAIDIATRAIICALVLALFGYAFVGAAIQEQDKLVAMTSEVQ